VQRDSSSSLEAGKASIPKLESVAPSHAYKLSQNDTENPPIPPRHFDNFMIWYVGNHGWNLLKRDYKQLYSMCCRVSYSVKSTKTNSHSAICLEILQDNDIVRRLPCHHSFHSSCLDKWYLRQHSSCPLCKRSFFTKSKTNNGDKSSS
jgi:hypothetical protein